MITDILINGMVRGGMYALLAVGFSLIFGVAKILNMAHTAFYMVAAYLILVGTSLLHFPVLVSLLLSIITLSILGMLCFKYLFDRVKEHATAVMLISVALAILCQEVLLLIFGGTNRSLHPFARGFVDILGIRVSNQHLIAILSCAVILIGLWLLLSRTRLGNAIRCVAEDKEIANLMGINVSRICMIVMGISAALAALAGGVIAPIFMASPFMWTEPLVIILAAAVLGGMTSLGGCVIGAFVLAYTETLVTFLIPGGSFLRGAVSLAIMVAVLLVRPEGLFGVVFEEERL